MKEIQKEFNNMKKYGDAIVDLVSCDTESITEDSILNTFTSIESLLEKISSIIHDTKLIETIEHRRYLKKITSSEEDEGMCCGTPLRNGKCQVCGDKFEDV